MAEGGVLEVRWTTEKKSLNRGVTAGSCSCTMRGTQRDRRFCCGPPFRRVGSASFRVWQASERKITRLISARDGFRGAYPSSCSMCGWISAGLDASSACSQNAMALREKDLGSCGSDRCKPVIGLAGGIGAGKSTVAKILETLGVGVIDSDRLAHEQLQNTRIASTIVEWWGEGIRDSSGVLDRRAIGKLVFENPRELARLEELLYPGIDRRRAELIGGFQADGTVRAIVLDTPKLFEAGLDRLCDAVIFVESDWSSRVNRVSASRGWSSEELARRGKLQDSLDSKRANADHVVENHADIEALRTQVESVFVSILDAFI